MLWSISVIFLSLWLVGIVSRSTLHGYLHVLLALAAGAMVLPLVKRKKQPLE